jgi:transcriptional regulator with XRE-family HTH domain
MGTERVVGKNGVIQDGAAIRQLRVQRKMRLAPAAELVGCHYKHLSRIEREMRGASLIMLQQIADAYGVSPERIKKRKTTRRAAAEEAQPASNAA